MFNRILLVDDSLSARMIIRQYLEIVGCQGAEFTEASNGKKALEILKEQKFDLIVTDMNMPVMDGNEFLHRLKASPKLQAIPVIIVSSAANKDNEERFMKF
ncbi:MAG: response regulator, partial [Pseudomonadales bacterium]|nr:response regulator [Pseudomonadales bacterium]